MKHYSSLLSENSLMEASRGGEHGGEERGENTDIEESVETGGYG
jgi:hypothetical protein